jgi:hypothetical protein
LNKLKKSDLNMDEGFVLDMKTKLISNAIRVFYVHKNKIWIQMKNSISLKENIKIWYISSFVRIKKQIQIKSEKTMILCFNMKKIKIWLFYVEKIIDSCAKMKFFRKYDR